MRRKKKIFYSRKCCRESRELLEKKKRSEPATTDWRLGGWVGKNGGHEEGVGVGRVSEGGDGGEVAREGCRSQSWVPSV